MEFTRGAVRYIIGSILSATLVLTAVVIAVQMLFASPTPLKESLENSGAYATMTDGAIKQASSSIQDPQAKQVINDPAVQGLIRGVYTPEVMRSSIGQSIDTFYAWLNGSSTLPSISLNAPGAQTQLIAGLTNLADERATQLPACTRQQLLNLKPEQNILTIPCKPHGLNTKLLTTQFVEQVTANTAFLNQAEKTITPTPELQRIRDRYLQAGQLSWVLVALLVLLSVLYILLHHSKLIGARHLSIIIFVSGALILLSAAASNGIIDRVVSSAGSYEFATNITIQTADIIKPFVNNFMRSLTVWGGAYAAAGAIGFIVAQILIRSRRV